MTAGWLVNEKCIATLIILNEEMEDIIKIVKRLEESGFLIKGISETIKNEAKEQKEEFLMLLGTLPASVLENALSRKEELSTGEGVITTAGQNVCSPNPLTTFKIKK